MEKQLTILTDENKRLKYQVAQSKYTDAQAVTKAARKNFLALQQQFTDAKEALDRAKIAESNPQFALGDSIFGK